MYEAIPYTCEFIGGDEPHAKERVAACLAAGKPVISGSEENDLVVGYKDGGKVLLVRSYSDAEKKPTDQKGVPWGYGLIGSRRDTKPDIELVKESLVAAVENMSRLHDGAYAGGWNAYRIWRRKLDETYVATCNAEELKGFCHANAYIYECLYDARKQASIYLKRVAPVIGGEAKKHLVEAAKRFEKVRDEVAPGGNTCGIAPYPWMIKEGQSWTAAQRKAQVQRLKKIEELDRAAFDELAAALKAMA